MIYYLLDSLNIKKVDFIYIAYNNEYSKYNFEDRLIKDYPNINFKLVKILENTKGVVETINFALKKLKLDDKPILWLNNTNFYNIDIINKWSGNNSIITFRDIRNKSIYSYVKIYCIWKSGFIAKNDLSYAFLKRF